MVRQAKPARPSSAAEAQQQPEASTSKIQLPADIQEEQEGVPAAAGAEQQEREEEEEDGVFVQNNASITFYLDNIDEAIERHVKRIIERQGGTVSSKLDGSSFRVMDPSDPAAVALIEEASGLPYVPVPWHYVPYCEEEGIMVAPEELDSKNPVFVTKNEKKGKGMRPLKVWIYLESMQQNKLNKYRRQIRRYGGHFVTSQDRADVVVVDKDSHDGKDIIRKHAKDDFIVDTLWIKTMLMRKKACDLTPISVHRLHPEKAKGVPPPPRLDFTPDDKLHLINFLARSFVLRDGKFRYINPEKSLAGISGNWVYEKDLCDPKNALKYPWASRHPWASWREHYQKHTDVQRAVLRAIKLVAAGRLLPGEEDENEQIGEIVESEDSEVEIDHEAEEIDQMDQRRKSAMAATIGRTSHSSRTSETPKAHAVKGSAKEVSDDNDIQNTTPKASAQRRSVQPKAPKTPTDNAVQSSPNKEKASNASANPPPTEDRPRWIAANTDSVASSSRNKKRARSTSTSSSISVTDIMTTLSPKSRIKRGPPPRKIMKRQPVSRESEMTDDSVSDRSPSLGADADDRTTAVSKDVVNQRKEQDLLHPPNDQTDIRSISQVDDDIEVIDPILYSQPLSQQPHNEPQSQIAAQSSSLNSQVLSQAHQQLRSQHNSQLSSQLQQESETNDTDADDDTGGDGESSLGAMESDGEDMRLLMMNVAPRRETETQTQGELPFYPPVLMDTQSQGSGADVSEDDEDGSQIQIKNVTQVVVDDEDEVNGISYSQAQERPLSRDSSKISRAIRSTRSKTRNASTASKSPLAPQPAPPQPSSLSAAEALYEPFEKNPFTEAVGKLAKKFGLGYLLAEEIVKKHAGKHKDVTIAALEAARQEQLDQQRRLQAVADAAEEEVDVEVLVYEPDQAGVGHSLSREELANVKAEEARVDMMEAIDDASDGEDVSMDDEKDDEDDEDEELVEDHQVEEEIVMNPTSEEDDNDDDENDDDEDGEDIWSRWTDEYDRMLRKPRQMAALLRNGIFSIEEVEARLDYLGIGDSQSL